MGYTGQQSFLRRQKLKKRRYKFTDKNQSRQGIISSVIGILAFLLTAGVMTVAYVQNGQAGKIIAIPGFLALLLSLTGLYTGIRGAREEDTYRLFPWLGCILNGIILAVYVMVYVLGW